MRSRKKVNKTDDVITKKIHLRFKFDRTECIICESENRFCFMWQYQTKTGRFFHFEPVIDTEHFCMKCITDRSTATEMLSMMPSYIERNPKLPLHLHLQYAVKYLRRRIITMYTTSGAIDYAEA